MWARRCAVAIFVAVTAVSAWGADPGRLVIGREALSPSFDDLWVVDRSGPALYQVLAAITRPGRFDAIVLTGSDGSRAEVVNHLLEIVPEETSHWVSREPVPVGISVDRTPDPRDLIVAQPPGPVVLCADDGLLPLAALIAMRTDAHLVDEAPSLGAPHIIQVGGNEPAQNPETGGTLIHLNSVERTLEFLNSWATRSAVLVFAAGTLLPEHVLYAFQRGLLLVQVVPPPFSGDDVDSEVEATLATASQIREAIGGMPELDGALPEALVIAGDWTQIPYRFARSTDPGLVGCSRCDNGIRTFAADAEYANFDADPWGEPEVPSGRLLSYDRDLLAVQTVIGVWHDLGAFEPAPRATFLGLIPNTLRDLVSRGWQEELWERQWELQGPQSADEYGTFAFDVDDFLYHADDSDIVLVHGHGTANALGDSRKLLDGQALASTAGSARPAFWFVSACATARHLTAASGSASPDGNGNLVSGLQTRLALGASLTVEVTASVSGNLVWTTAVLERGLTIGELVRRGWADAISAYRGDPDAPEIPPGLARRYGTDVDFSNAWISSFWVGDPLTVF